MLPLLVCIAVLTAQPTSPLPGTPEGDRQARLAVNAAAVREQTEVIEARCLRIAEELDALGNRSSLPADHWAREWAGSYCAGDGLSWNVQILIAPKNGFAWRNTGCFSLQDGNYGQIIEALPDGLRVRLTIPSRNDGTDFLVERLYFVRCGERRYLVPDALMLPFCNRFNARLAVSNPPIAGNPLDIPLRFEDEAQPLSGRPALPARYASLIRAKPMSVTVRRIERLEPNVTGPTPRTAALVTVEGGRDEGVYEGLEFPIGSWPSGGILTITSIDDHTSRGRFLSYADPIDPGALPTVGARLSNDYDWYGISNPGIAADVNAGSMLIIAPRALHESLRGYLAFKQTRLPTELVALEAAIDRTRETDDAAALKKYIHDRWGGSNCRPTTLQPPFRYILLVGDADTLPVRYMVLDRNTDAAFNYSFYPTDLYYADLGDAGGQFQTWNGDTDGFHAGYFGEVCGEHNKDGPINRDKIDYLPDVAVGRWPVSTPEEVKIVADKTIAYEKSVLSPDAPPKPAAALLAVDGWIDNRGLMDAIGASLGESWSLHKLYSGDDSPPTAAAVVDQLNAGARLIFHSGHGEPDAWAHSFGVADLPKLTNAAAPAIILSAGCSTAYFAALGPYKPYLDARGVEHKGTNFGEVFTAPPPPPACYQKGPFNHTGLGERLLRDGPTGAVAYFGCNTGSQPCGMTLLAGFADALGSAASPDSPASALRLGDCWMHAVKYYHQHEHLAELKPTADWYPPSVFFQGMKFILFGDPSIPVR